MNNIYKVIWSKAKNCYVVASEIARSHTKSATGSGKIGGVTRRSLLASLMALSLLCGGLGVASAEVDVKVDVSSEPGAVDVYTKTGVDTLLDGKADKTALETKANETEVVKNTTNIATNKENITKLENNKADKTYVDTELTKKADVTALGEYAKTADVNAQLANKADKTYVDNAVAGAVATADTNVDAKLAAYATTEDVDTKLAGKANKTDLEDATNRITTNETNITALQKKTTGLSEDGKSLNSMNNVETGALTVKGEISNGTVTTTLTAINDSIKQTGDNKTAIDKLNEKTAEISHEAGGGTNISGVKIKDGNIVGNGNSAITQLANVETDKIKADSINGKSLTGTTVATEKEVKDVADAVKTETDERKAADTALEGEITKNREDIATLNGKVATAEGNITDLKKKDTELEGRIKTNEGDIETNKNAISDINKRTAGIQRIDATKETTIEGNVTVNSLGNVTAEGDVTAKGKLTGDGVDAGAGAITTKGAVNAGSLNVTDASHLKGDVTMDKKLSVTGDTSLQKTDVDGALTVTGESNLKGNVTLGTPNGTNTVTVNGTANFHEVVNMDKGLTVTGATQLGNTTVDGDLKVTGTITTDKMVFGDKATNNYTEIDKGHITSKNDVLAGDATKKKSSMELDHSKLEVGVTDKDSNGHLTMTADQTSIKNSDLDGKNYSEIVADKDSVTTTVKDEKDNTTSTKSSATEIRNYAKDKDGNKTNNVQTATQNKSWAKDKDGNESSIVQTGKDITNTAQSGTITNDAQNIVNNATGDMTNTVGGELTTTVTGQATENFNGGLDTTVAGTEKHTVNGKQINTVTEGQENIISGGQTNTITGGQTNNITGDQTTTITGNKKETVTENVTEDYQKDLTTTVGGNETHEVKGTKTETVEGKVTENFKNGQETNVTGDQVIKVSGTQTTTATDINRNASSGMIDTIDNDYGTNTETKVAGKTTTDVSIKGTGEKGQYIRGANESRDYLIKGTLKNSETKTAEATSTEITDGNGKTSSTIQDVTQISGSVTDGTNTSVSNVKVNSIDSAVTDGSSISTINQKKNSITSQVTDGTTITKTEQDTKNITNTAKDGTITNDAKDIVNNASGNMTNTVGGDLTTTVSGNELHEVTGKQTNKIDGDQENTIGGNQTTTVTGDISNKAENITNEANTKLTDKVGEHTRVLDGDGITDTVGGSTFKQRIDKIMMESKDVSIKAEETLTNEAKVITNRASEVINNEAVNINNTATGIITSKASEIKNQADKLISNKVGENTWENMENGKITTSIKDGAKQNLIQSDAAGTTQSTVDGGKSTVTIQNADGLTDAVTDGRNTSVQNQTASQIAAAVKDGAGNENASVANATTSANTITNGTKANTVISTADGTSFINSEAAAPVTGASGAGTHLNTTIKGNTITTGKVTMDYAEVMKDLGVRGNANITGKTTTGSLEVKGESKLTGDVTMESNATVKKDLTVEGNTNLKNTKVDGTLDVTQKANFGDSVSIAKDLSVGGNATIKGDVTASSYKVGDKTYISAAGINANDQKITNVADGSISEGSKDAVNGGQLYTVKNDFEGKVNKVGANAAAMANLHPMEFDPSSKWNIAAAIGNYGSETAAALGAFYRPNDDVMVNLSTAFGTGENMVGGGVSVRLGKGGNKLSREESNALKAQVNDLTARMDALLSVLNPNMSKDFPDVPENHWAYEAVSRLAGNDIVQGYPDGEFHGDRTMTRYEMAEIIYNALSRGAEAEKELVEEFKPELQAMAASEKATAERAEG